MWSDARSVDGTVSIVQPLLQPMYGGKSAHEVIATLSDRPERHGYDVVREYWTRADDGLDAGGSRPGRPGGTRGPGGAGRPGRGRPGRHSGRRVREGVAQWLHDGFIEGRVRAAPGGDRRPAGPPA